MKKGAFIFVLHSHLPYVRKKGKWPHGEEMVFEAIAETYIPLLNGLHTLVKEGYHPQLTISLTPILLEQLSDPYLIEECITYIKSRIKACQKDIKIYSGPKVIKDKQSRLQHAKLARFYADFYTNALDSLTKTYKKNLVGAFKKLQDAHVLDIITSSATHAYLPLYYDEAAINEQLRIGIQTYKKYLGTAPRGIWLPECGYRPFTTFSQEKYPGFEDILEPFGIKYFFTDSHVFSSASSIEERTEAHAYIGPYDYRHITYKTSYAYSQEKDKPTYKPYYVSRSKVGVFARDKMTSLQVWSGEYGYPGDFYYREFHAKDAISGLQYCRITHHNGLADKALYEPTLARERVQEHADHFVHLVEDRITAIQAQTGEYPSIVSSYDTELFGHWWFEGIDWLMEVFKRMENSAVIDVSSADSFIANHAPKENIVIPESSWGLGGGHYVWMNSETEWIWPIIHDLSTKIRTACHEFSKTTKEKEELLNQAVRELLLLHSSDWPFLISTVQAKDWAIERFRDHQQKIETLLYWIYADKKLNRHDKALFQKIADEDNPFTDIDYRMFGNPA